MDELTAFSESFRLQVFKLNVGFQQIAKSVHILLHLASTVCSFWFAILQNKLEAEGMFVTFHLERTILRDMEAAIEEYVFDMDKHVTIALMNETWTSSIANNLPIASCILKCAIIYDNSICSQSVH